MELSAKNNHAFGPVGVLLNFIKLGEFAYGVPDVVRSPLLNDSITSIHSAQEVEESLNNSLLNRTILEPDSSGYTTPESIDTESSQSSTNASTTSGSFSLPPSESQTFLSELLNRVSTASNESISSALFDKLNSLKSIEGDQSTFIKLRRSSDIQGTPEAPGTSDIYNFMKTASFDDNEIAQVVHDLVFEKYEESYVRLLNKLKKLRLTEEENRFRSVVVELESVLKMKNANRQNKINEDDVNTPDRHETCSMESTNSIEVPQKMFGDIKKIYSSTDSELEHEVKPIGIPQSGILDNTFTKTTHSTIVKLEPVNQDTYDLDLKNPFLNPNLLSTQHIQDGTKGLHQYFPEPHAKPNNLSCPVFNVEAQVYSFNVEDKRKNKTYECDSTTAEAQNQRLLDKRKTYKKSLEPQDLDQIEELSSNSLYTSAVSQLVRSATNQSHESEYNEYSFLRAALGDELLQEQASSNEYIFPPTDSIATDDISELLSSTSSIAQNRRRRCRSGKSSETISTYDKKSLSICNTVLQRPTTFSKTSSTVDGSRSLASYESITNFSQSISTNQDKKLIKNKIFVHETIIDQAERALEYGRRKLRSFVGSPAHLEAERTLLVSKIRRQVLINTLYTIQDTSSDTYGRITIENLRCTLNTIRNNHHLTEQYYVCILQHKTTVYSTKIAAPNRLGWIDFSGCFIFDNVTNTFDIKIELHCVQLSQAPQNCFALPFLRATPKLPMMKLIGEVHIGIMNRKNDKFSLIYRNGERFSEHKLTASIQTTIKWPGILRGFLTIGIEKQEHQPIWNRRWCVLEDGKLKYYNYPSDEDYCKPVGMVDLETCRCCDDTYKKYLRQKTLALFTDSGNEFKTYYLSPDTTEDFNLWRKNVEVVLRLIKEWNMF